MTKEEKYLKVIPVIKSLLEGESDEVANMANVAAALKEEFGWWWVGFYRVQGEELVLGPFQGPVACTRIKKGRGVCGTAWAKGETIVVPDVEEFPGHIACSSASRSEIVVPIFGGGDGGDGDGREMTAELDIDSEHLAFFDEVDKKYLEIICALL